MQAKEGVGAAEEAIRRPLLMVDIDGVISLFGAFAGVPGAPGTAADASTPALEGSFHAIEGMPHFLSSTAAAHLLELVKLFDLVWASGWEERANEHLPYLLGLPRSLPFLRFAGGRPGAPPRQPPGTRRTLGHWKLEAIEAYAGTRALAWVDDALDAACQDWAAARGAPTLLVETQPERGLTGREAERLAAWARELGRAGPPAG
jgi:hypothetical protein